MIATIGFMSSSKSSPQRFFIRWWTKIDFFLHLRLLLLFDIHFASLLYPIFTQTTYLLSCLPLLKQQTSLVLKSKLAFLEVKIHSEGMMFSHWDRASKSLTINIMMLYSNLPFYALFIKKQIHVLNTVLKLHSNIVLQKPRLEHGWRNDI